MLYEERKPVVPFLFASELSDVASVDFPFAGVFTYHPRIASYLALGGVRVALFPLGYDANRFYRTFAVVGSHRILTSGLTDVEAIRDVHALLARRKETVVHIGVSIEELERWGDVRGIFTGGELPDSELSEAYRSVRYVWGGNVYGGFEMPILEGAACGAIPICFDLPTYRYWFGGFARFLHHWRGRSLRAGSGVGSVRAKSLPEAEEALRMQSEMEALFREESGVLADAEWLYESFSWDCVGRRYEAFLREMGL